MGHRSYSVQYMSLHSALSGTKLSSVHLQESEWTATRASVGLAYRYSWNFLSNVMLAIGAFCARSDTPQIADHFLNKATSKLGVEHLEAGSE